MSDYKVLDKGFVSLVDHMGSDLTVANAARVSFKKRREEFVYGKDVKGSDEKLINFLAQNNHWTPFGHCQVCLHLKVPLPIARQLMRSNVGIVYNETSRRYVTDEPEFYEPASWRQRPDGNIKQGSGSEMPVEENNAVRHAFHQAMQTAMTQYNWALHMGASPEMARMFLPQSMYTELWATLSLAAAARVVKLRVDPPAQFEVQEYGKAISEICGTLFPISWKALMGASE